MTDINTNSEKFKSCLKIVVSQTNYDEEKATQKLIEYKEDFIKVIKEYLNPNFDKKIQDEKITKQNINQTIIKQIRDFKDKQDKVYLSKKENVEKMKKLYQLHMNNKSD